MRDITIVNAHWNNRGDEAALFALINKVRGSYPDSRITIIFKDDNSIQQFPEIDGIDYFIGKFNVKIPEIWISAISGGILGKNEKLKKTVRKLKKTDLIIYSPGGSVINDRFFWRKQMEYLLPFLCSKLFRKPLFIAAPSMGPYDVSKKNIIRKWLLKAPQTICVREDFSRKYLEEIGITENVHVTMDLAFMDEIDMAANEKKLDDYNELKDYLNSHEKTVGITITDFQWHVKLRLDKELQERINESFHTLIEDLTGKGYGIVFIPQLFGNQNDYDYMSMFKNKDAFIMRDDMDAFFQQYVISQLYAVIGMRYHSNIFAAKMGTPFIAVVYEEKMEGFIELAELRDYALPLSEISASIILEKFSLLELNYQQIKTLLKRKNGDWRKRAVKTMELLRKLNNGKKQG